MAHSVGCSRAFLLLYAAFFCASVGLFMPFVHLTPFAEDRGTSPRTVANQVAALLRKFGVSSRYELVLAITRGHDA